MSAEAVSLSRKCTLHNPWRKNGSEPNEQ